VLAAFQTTATTIIEDQVSCSDTNSCGTNTGDTLVEVDTSCPCNGFDIICVIGQWGRCEGVFWIWCIVVGTIVAALILFCCLARCFGCKKACLWMCCFPCAVIHLFIKAKQKKKVDQKRKKKKKKKKKKELRANSESDTDSDSDSSTGTKLHRQRREVDSPHRPLAANAYLQPMITSSVPYASIDPHHNSKRHAIKDIQFGIEMQNRLLMLRPMITSK